MKRYRVAVIGVGAVGIEMIRVLQERKFPVSELKVLARSARKIEVDGRPYQVRETKNEEFKGIDIALFAGTEGEKGAAVTFAPAAVKEGAVVIDNGADFRMAPEVPLVVPEVNPEDVRAHKGIIANPNCSTIQMVVALAPLHRVYKIKRIIVSTYQAASGAGGQAIADLRMQVEKALKNEPLNSFGSFPYMLAFNVFPHIGKFGELDFTAEEWKMVKETHKIMHDHEIKINATTVRVPVFNGHSESVYIETEKKPAVDEARELLRKSKGVCVIDDLDSRSTKDDGARRTYPMPIDASGKDEVFVGRLRQDPFVPNGLSLWVVADNLRKGAALNAVQIAEEVIK